MIAMYLHSSRTESFDRARALAGAAGDDLRVVSPHPPRLGWSGAWSLLPDAEPETWADWLRANAPDTVIVDGPPEHARAVRDLGARLVVVALPGGGDHNERGSAYADADLLLAPWPRAAAGGWPTTWRERTLHLGALGWRAAQMARSARQLQAARRSPASLGHAIALWPTHAGPGPRERRSIAVETPGWRWTYATERDLLEAGPVWSNLLRADVAVCAPNPTTIAALAALQIPAVLVLPERATGAQEFLAEAAAGTAPVVIARPTPMPEEWASLLDAARRLDRARWEQWDPEPGLTAFAATLLGNAASGADGGVLVSA